MNLRIASFEDDEPKEPDEHSEQPFVDPTEFGIGIKEGLRGIGIDLTTENWAELEGGANCFFDGEITHTADGISIEVPTIENNEDDRPTLRFFDPESDEPEEV